MIKTELEWHSNDDTPCPANHWDDYLVVTSEDGYWHCEAMFIDDNFSHFTHYLPDNRNVFFDLEDVLCWALLTECTDIVDLFTDDKVTDCICGDTTPHEPWWEDCGLGKSEEHCREASEEPMGIGYYLRGINNKKRQEQEERAAQFLLDAIQEVKQALTGEEYLVPDDAKSVVEGINRASAILKEPEEDNSFIVANMAQCALCKDIIESHSRHDFVSCSCSAISCDGGHGYLRRLGERGNIIELSVYSTDDYETIRTQFKRGSRGVNCSEPLMWVPLKNMTDGHLSATIDYEKNRNPDNKFIGLYEQELKYRRELENEGVFKGNEK